MFDGDASQIIVIGLFIATAITCVSIGVRYVRNHVVKQVQRDIIDGAHQIKNNMRKGFEDATAQANIAAPEDIGDGRSF